MLREKLAEKKDEQHITVQQIADRCNTPASTISRVLSGQTENPSWQTVCDIAHGLECSLDDLDDWPHSRPNSKDQAALIAIYETIIAAKNKWINRLVVICIMLVAVLVFLLVYDAIHPQVGFMQY